MRIKVQLRDGSIETLTLVPPIEIREPTYEVPEGMGRLAVIVCGDGTKHFFVENTGHYDGWARAFSGTEDEAYEAIENVNDAREIESPGRGEGKGK